MISNCIFSQQIENETLLNREVKEKSGKLIGSHIFGKARFFFFERKWDSTLVYTMKELSSLKNNNEIQNYCHYFRGTAFQQKKIFEEAEKEFHTITQDFQFYKHVKRILGEIALENNNFQKAISHFEKAQVLYEDVKIIATIEHDLGLCHLHLKEFDKAELYLKMSMEFYESQNDTLMLIGAYGNVANMYYEQYKDSLAVPYFKKAYKLSNKIRNFDVKRRSAKNMAVVEENRKNFAKALVYRKEYEQWKDSLNNQNKIWNVAQAEKKFAVAQKQKEVSLLQAQNKVKIAERNGLLYSALILLVLLGTGIYFYRQKIKTNKIIAFQKEGLTELNATKDKLFSIVSHDLRSSVNAIKTSNQNLLSTLETQDLKDINSQLENNSAIVNGAYNLLDNLLHWALLQTEQSYFEIVSLRLFFIVEQVAYNYQPLLHDKQISFENTVSKKVAVAADQESLKIVLRNLIDNAIKFSEENGSLKIYAEDGDKDYYKLIVEDAGMGMEETTRLELLKDTQLLSKKKHEDVIGTGLGLQLCKSMIQKNKGKLAIESTLGKGTKMIISLPKTTQNG